MEKEPETLEERIGTQEQYSSKDTILIDDLLIYDDIWLLFGNVLQFFDKFIE